MIPLRHRTKLVFCLAIGLLFVSLGNSCQPPKTEPAPDAKADLLTSLKGANVEGYDFSVNEDESQVITAMTNGAVRDLIKLDGGTTNMVLRYATVKDKKTNSSRSYKTELVKTGNELTLLVTDFATGAVVTKDRFPPGEPHPEPTFNNLDECIADFNCKHRAALIAEANRTCKAQFAGLICFFKDGTGVSVHFIFPPTSRRCLLIGTIPDLEGILVSR